MQDYFRLNKNQQGSSLFMKSDAGSRIGPDDESYSFDAQNRGMPLGIKTTAQGIEHFTNWESIANSIEAKNFARFDDSQPTSLKFSTMEQIPSRSRVNADDSLGFATDIAGGRRKVEFTDTWTPNDIKILDDIAFVAQDEYTDIHRKDIVLAGPSTDGRRDRPQALKQFFNVEQFTPGAGGKDPGAGADDGTGTASWTSSGSWASNFEGSSPTGDITVTYTPSTSTWTLNAVVPNDGGWGGTITGTKVQNACSCTGGGCASTQVSIPVTGTHYCGGFGPGGSETYSGFFVFDLTPSSSAGEDCTDAILLSYASDSYMSSGGCSIGFSVSSETYNGYVPSGGGGGGTETGNDAIITSIRRVGTLGFETQALHFDFDKVYSTDSESFTDEPGAHNFTSDFDSYSSAIIKVTLAKNGTGESKLPKNMYFMFGGAIEGGAEFNVKSPNGQTETIKKAYLNSKDIKFYSPARNIGQTDPSPRISNCKLENFRDWKQAGYPEVTGFNRAINEQFEGDQDLKFLNDRIVGYYYLVIGQPENIRTINGKRLIKESYSVGIQFSIQDNWGQDQTFDGTFDDFELFKNTTQAEGSSIRSKSLEVDEVKIMKFQPVRKCGKVDIYARKRGIISSLVANSATSTGHNLNTNDVIKISSAVFDGGQNGVADIHPLNGNKFVKKIDDDTFEIYDDQFFREPTSTLNLKTTDGVVWTCISNNFGSLGQSWDYYGTMFSPTGRNGYSYTDAGSTNFLAAKDSFFTTKRIKSFFESSSPASSEGTLARKNNYTGKEDSKTINLEMGKFSNYGSDGLGDSQFARAGIGPLGSWVNTNLGKDLEDNIPITFSENYTTPLDDPKRGMQDFFPYYCQDDLSHFVLPNASKEGEDIRSPYPGMRFGSSMDLKFSHNSGNSKVYTLAVGERGSDVSVDLFGQIPQEQLFEKPSMEWNGSELQQTFKPKVLPYYLPYGRTHLISITIDQYGKISDIAHEDTVFGGGNSISNYGKNDTVGIEYNPWSTFESLYRVRNYRFYQDPAMGISDEGNSVAVSFANISDFNETLGTLARNSGGTKRLSSRYWLRSLLVHWDGQNISNRYSRQEDGSGPNFNNVLDRNLVADRKTIPSTSFFGEEVLTRFGEGAGLKMVDRFGDPNDDLFGDPSVIQYWAVFPWIDSFGKSVAIKNDISLDLGDLDPTTYPAASPKTVILSASRSKSQVDMTNAAEQPVLASNANLTVEETTSELGQITAHFLYKDSSNVYRNVDYIPFNSGGSRGGRFATGEAIFKNSKPGTDFEIEYSKLMPGTAGGVGMAEVITSSELSCSKIIWNDDYIVWSEQNLAEGNSIIHLFTFDGKFKPAKSISKPFDLEKLDETISSASYVGEGFGLDFKYQDRLFISNALSQTDEGGNLIPGVSGLEGHFIDQIFVYEMLRNVSTFEQSQKILPAIDDSREDYYSEYFKSAQYLLPYLIPVKNAFNHDNNPLSTSVWDIDLTNRYDLSGKKIILKDALEYSVFDRDYSQNESFSISEPYSARVPIYLGISEDTSIKRLKSTSSLSYNYIPQSTTEYDCANSGGSVSEFRVNKTPVFFFNLPLDSLDMVEDVTINFDILEEDIFSAFQTNTNSEDTNNIIPRLVLYSKDPRSTIIENGPATNGSGSTSYPQYEDGLWSRPRWDAGPDSEYYSDMYPGYYRGGAQDLFFYGRLPGSFIRTGTMQFPQRQTLGYLYGGNINLGEYYDLTAGSRGGGEAGDPAWIAPDVYQHFTAQQRQHVLPYAKIFLPEANSTGYSVTLSAQDIRNFVIKGSLVKDNIDNRPTTVAGSFSDTANLYEGAGNITYTLAIGFALTNVNSFNIATGQTQHEEPSLGFDVGPIRYIHTTDSNGRNFPDARYPYSFDVNFYENTANGAEVSYTDLGLNQLNYELRAKVRNLDASVSKKRLLSRRYRNTFHKIAVFRYDEEERDSVREVYIDGGEAKIYSQFGANKLVPVPEANRDRFEGKELAYGFNDKRFGSTSLKKFNPVIAIGESFASSDSAEVKDGSFSKSLQIVNSENIFNSYRGTSSNIYLDSDTGNLEYVSPPTGYVIGESFFDSNTLFGGFDIQSPEYLSLFINSNPTAKGYADLTLSKVHQIQNVNTNLVVDGFTTLNKATSLWTGVNEFKQGKDLFLRALLDNKDMSLFTFEIAPSAVATLFTDAPDVTGDITLIIAPPVTASGNLFTVGPILNTGSIPLNIQSHANISKGATLSSSGVFFDSDFSNLYTVASVPEFKTATLAMNPVNSGSMPLFIVKHPEATGVMNLSIASKASGVQGFNLFTGDQFDVHERFSDLFIKSQQFASGQAVLYNEGFLDTANSNKDTNTTVAASLSNELFDRGGAFGEGKENAISKTLSGRTYQSNSVVCSPINQGLYTKNRMRYDRSSRDSLWFMSANLRSPVVVDGLESTDPALVNSTLGGQNLIRPFYENNNKQDKVQENNSTIKNEAYDLNDDYLVKACLIGNSIQLDMYTVNEDGSVSQQGEKNKNGIIRSYPANSAAQANEPNDGILDAFYELRNDLYEQVKIIHDKDFAKSDIVLENSQISVNDLKLSSNNKCAMSFRIRLDYRKDLTVYSTTFNVITIFRITGYQNLETGFASDEDYNFLIFQETGEDTNKQNSGYNVAFDYQDLYFDRRGISQGSDGEVWRSLASDGYSSSERVVKFSDLSDSSYYATNAAYVTEDQRKTGFGYPIKIFDEHNTNNRIMLVGATLFDPYMFNTLEDSHATNAMGAVYIYKKSVASQTWTYHGAVYSKGFTSDNVLSNLSSYRGGQLSTRQSALFGYDFDYNEDILVVSEPGGDGSEVVNAGKAYAFDISSTPVLVKTYSASDISLPNGSSISSGDSFGSNIVILGKEDVLSWSDATLSQDIDLGFNKYQNDSTIYNLRNNSVFGLSYENSEGVLSFVPSSIEAEINPYNAGGLNSFSEDNIYRWSRIVSIKKFKARSQDRLLVVREFSLKLNAGSASDVANKSIRVQKLSVVNLDRSPNGTLFIKGPSSDNNLAPLYSLGLGPSGFAPLVIPPPRISLTGIAPLFVNNLSFNQKMSLMTERVDNPYFTLNIDGIVGGVDSQTNLFVRNQELNNNTTLVTMPSAASDNVAVSTFVQGSIAASDIGITTLFVGKEVNSNELVSLYMQTWPEGSNFTPGSLLGQEITTLSISGMFENAFADPQLGGVNFYMNAPIKASGVGFMPNVVKTEMPVIGTGGSFVESGVISMVLTGNNPANVFTKNNQDASLTIASNVIQSGAMPIFMQRPFANAASLFIDSRISSGVQDLYVDGANIANSGMNLITKTPENNNFNIFTRGFLE